LLMVNSPACLRAPALRKTQIPRSRSGFRLRALHPGAPKRGRVLATRKGAG
jgi:hypothetical protein